LYLEMTRNQLLFETNKVGSKYL